MASHILCVAIRVAEGGMGRIHWSDALGNGDSSCRLFAPRLLFQFSSRRTAVLVGKGHQITEVGLLQFSLSDRHCERKNRHKAMRENMLRVTAIMMFVTHYDGAKAFLVVNTKKSYDWSAEQFRRTECEF